MSQVEKGYTSRDLSQGNFPRLRFDWTNFGDFGRTTQEQVRRSTDSTAEVEDKRKKLAFWMSKFSGAIPQSWGAEDIIRFDIGEASDSGIRLSDVLLDAAIVHPNPDLAKQVGIQHGLDPDQLAVVLYRTDGDLFVRDAQVTFGASYEDLEEAQIGAISFSEKLHDARDTYLPLFSLLPKRQQVQAA